MSTRHGLDTDKTGSRLLLLLLLPAMYATLFLPVTAFSFHIKEPQVTPEARALVEESLSEFRKSEHVREEQAAEKVTRILKKFQSMPQGILPDDFLKRYNARAFRHTGKSISSHPQYALFISSSMPLETLRAYVAQINNLRQENINVVMYLRGFVKGMRRMGPTVSFYFSLALQDMDGPRSSENLMPAGFFIDPAAFKKFHVNAVPALVDMKTGCTVSGDARLEKLIEELQDMQCGERVGAVFEVAEPDPVEEIKEAVLKISWGSVRENIKKTIETSLGDIKPEIVLPPASEDKERLLDFSATLPFDVTDPRTQKVLYPKGFTYQPLDYISPQGSLVIFNGVRRAETAWLREQLAGDTLENPVRIATLGGNIRMLSDFLSRPVFAANAISRKALQKGWCRATPCVLSFRDRKILAREFAVQQGEVQ